LGLFVEHLVCALKIKGLETPLKSAQPLAKSTQNQSQIIGAQSKSGFVPKINKNNEQKWRKRKKMGFGICWGKTGNQGVWWPAVGGNGRQWCRGWRWCVVGLDFRERLEAENGEGEGMGEK
jgi:hypothetical protein